MTKKKVRSDKGKPRIPWGQRKLRIRPELQAEPDLNKLAAALLMLARKNVADNESDKADSATAEDGHA